MKQLLFILFFLPSLLYSQSEGGFGFRRFANTANLTATSVNNSDKNASRRAYVHSTGLYYRWNGSAWAIEETIDTFSVSGVTLSLSILNDGVPAKTVNIAGSIYTAGADSTFVKNSGSYLGKRITDKVYRTGNSGFGRTATDSSRIAVSVGDSLNRLPILITDSYNGWFMKPGLIDTDADPFGFSLGGSLNTDGTGTRNNVYRLSINRKGAAQYFSNSTNYFGDEWETDWASTNDPGHHVYERHIAYNDSSGVSYRPFTMQLYRDGSYSDIGTNVDVFNFRGREHETKAAYNARVIIGGAGYSLFNAPFTSVNDTLGQIDLSDIEFNASIVAASKNPNVSISAGVGTAIVLRGNESTNARAAIIGKYNGTNTNTGLDLILATQANNSTGVQLERVFVQAGQDATEVGIGISEPVRTIDVNGHSLFRGALRVNNVGDSSGITVKYASTQTTPIFRIQYNNGTQAAYAHVYNSTNPTLVFGNTTSVDASSPKNTVFGITTPIFTVGAGDNALFGSLVGDNLNGGYRNAGFGSGALGAIIAGNTNSAFGWTAGAGITSGSGNAAFGGRALLTNSTGTGNLAVGSDALRLNTGSNNVGIGYQAGDQTTGNNNLFVGAASGRLNTGSTNIFLGYSSGENETGSSLLYIEPSNSTTPLIKGDFAADTLRIFGYLETGREGTSNTTSPLKFTNNSGTVQFFRSSASPEGVITANEGDFAFTNISSTGRWWGKQTGTGNTGWVEFYTTGNLPSSVNIYTDDGTTDEAERTVTLLDDINFIGASGTADFYVEAGATGGRLDVSVDSSRLYFTDGSGTNAVSSSATTVMLKTGAADQVTILTDKINLVDVSGTTLDFEVKDDTRFKVDSLEDFAIGRWPNFPDAFEYLEKNRYGLLISDNTSSGKKTTIAGMAYDRTSSSYITSDRGSYQFNTSNYLASGTAEMVTGATPPSFYNYNTHPLEPYDNIEMGFRNQWVGIPKDKTQYAYLYQGGDRTASAPFDTAAITMWIGIPQITDTTATAKSTLGTKAVSKVRGWGVQSLFHRTSTQQIEHPFNWIKISTGSVAADTLVDGINFYGRYAFENSAPSVTSGDTSLMAWVGTGSATTPMWMLKSQFGSGGSNIYNSNGTTTANTRTATILESIRFVGTADIGQQYPFQVHSTGNEPPIQLWKGNTDSVYLYQSDVEYHYGSSTVFQIESSEYLILSADSIQASTLSTKTKIQNIVGISNSGTLQQIEGTSGGQVLTWNASGYWELGSGGGGGDGIYGGSGTIPDNTDATITSTGDFRFLYSGGNPAFEFDDGLNQVYISGQNGTYSAYADNSNVGLVAGTGTWLVGSDYALTATASVANTNTQADRLVIQTNSSGTASTNFGSSILFQGESSTTDNRDMLTLGVGWSTVTDASRTAYLDVNPIISGTEVNMYRFGSTGLLVRNTSGSNTMTISSAGLQGTQSMTLGASGNSVTLGGSSGAVTIQSSSNTTTAIVLQPTNNTTGGISIGGVALTSTTLDKKEMRWGSTYTASSGSGVHTALAIQNTYNLTSTASGLQTSILIDPTFTSLTGTYRAIDITANNSSAKGIYQTGSSTVNNFVGPTGFGATTVPDDAIEVTGNLEFLTAGNKIKIATGSNASAGQSGAMTAGSITISTTAVTSNSLIFLNHASVGGTQGILSVGTITAGTSFVINSSSALDTSTVNWWIIN